VNAEEPSLLRRTLVAAAATRFGVFIVAFATTSLFGVAAAPWDWRFPRGAETFHGLLGRFFNPWAHWDGVWYIKIAQGGYADVGGSTAFFPLYPFLLRYAGYAFHGNLVITGIVLSLIFYAAAVVLLYRLVSLDYGPRVAYRTVLYLSVFPTAFFLQAIYTESLFLMLSVACIYWSRLGRWRLAGLAGLLAALSRSSGVLLLAPMVIIYYEARQWRLKDTDANAANLLMVPEGLLVWMTYLSLGFHRPLLFLEAQGQWRRAFALPHYAVWRGLVAALEALRQLLSGQVALLYWQAPSVSAVAPAALPNILAFATLTMAGALLFSGARRLPLAYSVYALLSIGFPLLYPSQSQPLLSLPRFALTTFPLFIALALVTERRPRLHVAVVVAFLVVLVWATARFATFGWVS
jgi:hypothetical protein